MWRDEFFVADTDSYGLFEEGGFKVIYHDSLDNFKEVENLSNSDFSPVIKEGRLNFEVSEESVTASDVLLDTFRDRFSPDLDEVLTDILYSRLNSGFGSKLLGYPAFTQLDSQVRYDDGYDTLLFQLDSDYEFTRWGDSGVCHFFINSEKLKKGDFSDVLYHWDCY